MRETIKQQLAAVKMRLESRKDKMTAHGERFLADCLLIVIRSIADEELLPTTRIGDDGALGLGSMPAVDGANPALLADNHHDTINPPTQQIGGQTYYRGRQLANGSYEYLPQPPNRPQSLNVAAPAANTPHLEDVSGNLARAQGGPPANSPPAALQNPDVSAHLANMEAAAAASVQAELIGGPPPNALPAAPGNGQATDQMAALQAENARLKIEMENARLKAELEQQKVETKKAEKRNAPRRSRGKKKPAADEQPPAKGQEP
jgi:hypothetical protein